MATGTHLVDAFAFPRTGRGLAMGVAVLAAAVGLVSPAGAAPPIRVSATNQVPACVTPDRLMAFTTSRNAMLEPRFADIARWYKTHGEAWRVRWDYAFFQMLIETNYLQFRRPDGKPGDVRPAQNNFAGIGTTGGGVPGDSFPNVSLGVLGQIQHLVVYSGERIANPVAPRTRLKQDDILSASAAVAARRPLDFQDLAGRWAVDRRYGRSIEGVAELYRARFCSGAAVASEPGRKAPAPGPAPVLAAGPAPAERPQALTSRRPADPVPPMPVRATKPGAAAIAAVPAPRPVRCRIQTASFGGRKALLIRAVADGEARYTALQVLDGFERSMADSFIRTEASGGTLIGEFATREQALARAAELCPGASPS